MSIGIPLDQAAASEGIPINECNDYLNKKAKEFNSLNYELRKAGQEALRQALTKLTELANGDAREGKFFESTDLLAARELARTAIAALRLSKTEPVEKEPKPGEQGEFDFGPWDLKAID